MHKFVPFMIVASVAGCSSDATLGSEACVDDGSLPSKTDAKSQALPGPEKWNRDVTKPADDKAMAGRSECSYKAGSLAAETQGSSRPNGTEIPINHILLVMKENRSFDHMFQMLPQWGQPDVEVAPDGFTNPDKDGKPVAPFHDTQACFPDTNHTWAGVHRQENGGKMDGFVITNDHFMEDDEKFPAELLSGKRAMGYNAPTDLPFYYWLANEFGIADHYFCSVLGPTFVNRLYFYTATSFGLVDNGLPSVDTTDRNIFDELEKRQVDWKVYAVGTPGFGVLLQQAIQYKKHIRPFEEYLSDAAAGTLPSVAFIDPDLGTGRVSTNDEHPPSPVSYGEQWTATVVDALTKSPNWGDSALFFTYDEHGGLFDHVVPPKACPPGDMDPKLSATDPKAGFDQLGIRVPMIVVSPYAKKHFVGHRTYDHTSILRFIEARFVLPALTNRDANAEAPWEFFDFENAQHKCPPSVKIPAGFDAARLEACKKQLGKD